MPKHHEKNDHDDKTQKKIAKPDQVDIDFQNAAGFVGRPASHAEAQYVVFYLSHALLFCTGSLLEPHVVLTPAACVVGERYKFEVAAGTHEFIEYAGSRRMVENVCTHKGYNHTGRWEKCSTDNLALMVVSRPYSFRGREDYSDYAINRLRYGVPASHVIDDSRQEPRCMFYGWGSRRNGYLVPLLLHLQRVDVRILPAERCAQMWNVDDKYLCLHQAPCISEKFGQLCPDDMGSVIECDGYIYGMMTSQLVDRPCGVGFLDLTKYNKFVTCAVDDSREVLDQHSSVMSFDLSSRKPPVTVATPGPVVYDDEQDAENVTASTPIPGF